MSRDSTRRLSLRLLAGLVCGAALLVTTVGDADGYRFVHRDKLNRELKNWVGKKVTTTDKLTMVYPDEFSNHVFFETHYFRCAIPTNNSKGVEYIKTLYAGALKQFKDLREELDKAKSASERNAIVWKIYKRWKEKPIVTMFGTVDRPELWGQVAPAAKSSGVVSERIVFVIDRLEKPRKRWYKEIK